MSGYADSPPPPPARVISQRSKLVRKDPTPGQRAVKRAKEAAKREARTEEQKEADRAKDRAKYARSKTGEVKAKQREEEEEEQDIASAADPFFPSTPFVNVNQADIEHIIEKDKQRRGDKYFSEKHFAIELDQELSGRKPTFAEQSRKHITGNIGSSSCTAQAPSRAERLRQDQQAQEM
jgi:hypothetical protein